MNIHPTYRIWPEGDGAYSVRDTARDHQPVAEGLSKSDAQKEAKRLNGLGEVKIPRIPGAKWLREAAYISNETRRLVVAEIAKCREAFPHEPVMIRPSSYLGNDCDPHVTICYGVGQRIWRSI